MRDAQYRLMQDFFSLTQRQLRLLYILAMGIFTNRKKPAGPTEEELRAREQTEKDRKLSNRNAAVTAYAAVGAIVVSIAIFGISRWGGEPVPPLGIVEVSGTSNLECGLDQVAMFTDPPAPGTQGLDVIPSKISAAGPAQMWGTAFLQFTLTAAGNSSYTILDLKVKDSTSISTTPNWLYFRAWDGCGSLGDKVVPMWLQLDSKKLSKQPPNSAAADVAGGSPFDPFSVTKDATFTIKVYASACETSGEFNLELSYQKASESKISTKIFGPYQLYAANTSVPIYEEQSAGEPLRLTNRSLLHKPVAGCNS